ncbi:gliding motility-associated C-terminal domain-containing protein [Mucilaginibacter sp. OK098]|uniref:gliding motility-associated C-terminal domain-containing protein n=1 Tax=Mucilaginibacter sp. OK098 TaxID=1855297 RepID=UPI000910C304|nr:gliding motility-associated C-terminal domain-containing protein [Mucilaginibacter sp. OK098]SHN29404.1 gliding motility-associated C-terminal domain-containing protein [Mucilaginibacter sp. OK098]
MMTNPKHIYIVFLLLFWALQLKAQNGAGSMTVDNSTVNVVAGTTEQRFSEGSYFGPNANWVIDGTLDIWSKNVWIAPGATFSGSGRIVIHNPGTNPFYTSMRSGPTNIDGNNGNFINLLIEHQNNSDLILSDISDPGYGTTNASGESSAALNIAGTLDLAVDHANVILNGHNLAFNTSGKIENYGQNRMVSTGNSTDGHMVKEYADNSAFVFPVGIDEGDYTPATLTPQSAGKLYVSVQDYRASLTTGFSPKQGMDRSWHIYSSAPAKVNMTLQHNVSTDGSLFKEANAAISQYNGGTKWNYYKTINTAVGVHTSNDVDLIANLLGNGVWFTKYAVNALNIPNVFTPNGDGNNDTFEIRGLELFAENDMIIVNRWGNEVFKQTNYKNTWTGDGLNEGTYYYILRVKEHAGDEWQVYKGYITLIRAFTR